jgi:glycosyltransferase involved in cell wall biosynthesis
MARSNGTGDTDELPSRWVSVVIPTRDRPLLVAEAMRSAIGVDGADVIVVDDGSVASDVVARFSDGFLQVQTLTSGGVGASGSRNVGAAAATTPWLVFLDDDDLLHPSGLLDVHRTLAATQDDVGLVFCHVETTRPGDAHTKLQPVGGLGPLFHSVEGQFGAGGFCIRRDVFNLIGAYSPNLRYSENTDLLIRAVDHCVTRGLAVITVDTCLALIRLRPLSDRVLSDPLVLKTDVEFLLVEHRTRLLADPAAEANFHRIAGINAARLRLPQEARAHLRRALDLDDRFKDRIRLALLRLPLVWRCVWPRSPRSRRVPGAH